VEKAWGGFTQSPIKKSQNEGACISWPSPKGAFKAP